MRNRSAANSAASSPPVPARTSRMALFSSAASLGSSCSFSCCSSASRRGSSASRSARAIALISLSEPDRRAAPRGRRCSLSVARSASMVATIGLRLANSFVSLVQARLVHARIELGLDRVPAADHLVELVFGIVLILKAGSGMARWDGAPKRRLARPAHSRSLGEYRLRSGGASNPIGPWSAIYRCAASADPRTSIQRRPSRTGASCTIT